MARWKPILEGLKHLAPGGRLVVNAIRNDDVDKHELLKLDYPTHLWQEKEIKSVADANRALLELKQRKIRGAKVLRIE